MVSVKASVESPYYKWGPFVNHSSVGIVTKLDEDGQIRIDFPGATNWMGKVSEIGPVPDIRTSSSRDDGDEDDDDEFYNFYDDSD